jgi:uncharacterized protein YutE (UPF0331/DUF86 family)
MTYNLELLKADVLDELAKLERLKAEFSAIEHLLDTPKEKMSFYDRSAIGYYLHSFYNGCENIFRSIARFFENDVAADSWHSDLLKRMKLSVPGYRPAVIDEHLFVLLDDFRAFRHRFRHAYTFELDWEKERLVAQKFLPTFELLREQVTQFLDQIDAIDL